MHPSTYTAYDEAGGEKFHSAQSALFLQVQRFVDTNLG